LSNSIFYINPIEEVLSLYKDGLEKKIILQDGVLSRFTYHNIVAAALKIQDYEWIKKQWSNFEEKLKPKKI